MTQYDPISDLTWIGSIVNNIEHGQTKTPDFQIK